MITRLDNVKLRLGEPEQNLVALAKKKLRRPLKYFKILKKSLDARDKGNIFWVYSIAFSDEEPPNPEPLKKVKNPPRVAIVGSGPAGLACALRLIEAGIPPIIIERGEDVDGRAAKNAGFFNKKELNPDCNVQFGEGGAGAFSDGKLNTQTHGGYNAKALEYFARFGAPEEILYLNKPHIGSDKLRAVLKNIRAFIKSQGGEYLFNTRFINFESSKGRVLSAVTEGVNTLITSTVGVDYLVLAVGHSARDTFINLHNSGVIMTPREFSVGVRVEHLASQIGLAQYGKQYVNLPAADYKLVSHASERTVFTFCMCPGGVVIPAASESGGVVVNGMSEYARSGANSNSALMVQTLFSDYAAFGGGLFAGMEFQRSIERAAFNAGGGDYSAPVQLVGDFLKDKISQKFGEVSPTYAAGVKFAPLSEILPAPVTCALKAAIPDMGKKLKGFDGGDAILTGVETRFSSPVRMERGEGLSSASFENLYPCGEGSGYSGGITSSAADGIKIADAIISKCLL